MNTITNFWGIVKFIVVYKLHYLHEKRSLGTHVTKMKLNGFKSVHLGQRNSSLCWKGRTSSGNTRNRRIGPGRHGLFRPPPEKSTCLLFMYPSCHAWRRYLCRLTASVSWYCRDPVYVFFRPSDRYANLPLIPSMTVTRIFFLHL